MSNIFKAGLVQMDVIDDKESNLIKASHMVQIAAKKGAKLVVLPEMFNCPYDINKFSAYAEKAGDYSWQKLSQIAQYNGVYLVGGSIPEFDNEKLYNTSYIFDNQGRQIGKYRKMHLFDIDVEGGQVFKESDVLTAGNAITVLNTPFGKMGIIICYDIRFPEISRLLTQKGCSFIIVPAAFNMTTGPAHWEITFRTRALDNQVYTIGVSPARNYDSKYISYGNSLIAGPWGDIVNKLGEKEDVLVENINIEQIHKVRESLPLLKHVRNDIYLLKEKTIDCKSE